MKTSQRRKPRPAGFTLLEAVVALAIALGAIAVAIDAVVSGLRESVEADAVAGAVTAARSRLAGLTPDAIRQGVATGTEGPYRWQTTIRPLATVPVPSAPPNARFAPGVTLYDIELRVTWGSPDSPRIFRLQTHRLGAAP